MPATISQKVQDKTIQILTKNDAELISFEKGRKLRYRCSCGNETESYISNIVKPTWKGGCVKCNNQRKGNKHDYEFARKVWEDGGEVLPKQEYKGNKIKMFYICSNCEKEAHMSLNDFRRGRRCEHCSKSRAKHTNLQRYGVENPFQSEQIKQRIKNSNIDKYGVKHHMQVPEILQKAINTNIDKYGLEYSFHSEDSFNKIRETCIERYGVEYPLQNEGIRNKANESFKNKYGVEYPAQCEDIFYKIMVECKEYKFPSGRVEYCQGYEPRCFDYLLEKYDEDDIVVGYKEREPIWYSNQDRNGKMSRYYPDGFIISENAVIEVKSLYYFERDLKKNLAKFRAVVDMGMKLFLYVFNEDNLLYSRIYTKGQIVHCQYPPVEIIFVDD